MNISAQERKIILQASESFLFFDGVPWEKKGGVRFDIGMGTFHGAQVCELVGLFLMSKIRNIPDLDPLIYRDDVLAVTKSTTRQQEKNQTKNLKCLC